MRGCACRGTAGLAHVSCLAEQAKILFAEAEENNLGVEVKNKRWDRWQTCSLCEQDYYGVVRCALGWACWKTYVGRPETDEPRQCAMNLLACGLQDAGHYEDVLLVYEAELSMFRRLGGFEGDLLVTQSNLACVYQSLGRLEEALRLKRDVYSGRLKLLGEEHRDTLISGHNYASSLVTQERFEEAKALQRKMMPVARRVLGDSDDITLKMRFGYARAFYRDKGATLDDLRECVTTLEETERTARRVLGGAHPTTVGIGGCLRESRAVLAAREGNVEPLREAMDALKSRDA